LEITLREVRDADLPVLFTQMQDPESVRMAAFTAEDPSDRARFEAHWARIRQDPNVTARTIVGRSGEIVGHTGVFGPTGEREVTYWIGREYWGRGAASSALRELLGTVPDRPLHARAAADNSVSVRVLEKCGFVVTGHERGFANARGAEIDEVLLTLHA
jgi:RimJ/RimL family protein N-acetyltransferase